MAAQVQEVASTEPQEAPAPPPAAGTFPPEIVAWVEKLHLSSAHQDNLLAVLTGDDYGATTPADLAELEAEDVEEVKKKLPKLKRAAFQREIDQLKAAKHQQYRKVLDEQIVNAAKKGDTAKIRSLLAQGADPNGTKYLFPFFDTYTALQIAAWCGRNDAVTVLLDAGATINAESKDRHFTPLIAAAIGNEPSTVQLLCARGADTTIKDNHGNTALAIAKQFGRSEIAAFLQQKPH